MISYNRDGSVLLTDDADSTRNQIIAAGSTQAQIDAAIAAFGGSLPSREPMLSQLSARELMQSLVDAGILTAAKRDSILAALKRN